MKRESRDQGRPLVETQSVARKKKKKKKEKEEEHT